MREASAVVRSTMMGIPEPQSDEWATGTAVTHFFTTITANEDGPAASNHFITL